MELEVIGQRFSVCKVDSVSQVDLGAPFCFFARTDEELSLVCPTEQVPSGATAREDGWRAFRVRGQLDFSLVGVLAKLSAVLADRGIGIFVVSTFDTDYVLTKERNLERALAALRAAGYDVEH